MDDYKDMLESYKESVCLLKGRIDELNTLICGYEPGGDGDVLGKLAKRRYKLYQEIWELQACMRMIREYIEAVEEREGQGCIEGLDIA